MLYAFLYMLFTAVAGVAIHILAENLSASIILFWATFTGVVIFNLSNLKRAKSLYRKIIFIDKKSLITLNIYVMFSCISLFVLQSFFDPSLVLLLCFSFLTLIGTFASLKQSQGSKGYKYISAVLVFNIILMLDYYNAKECISSLELYVGVAIFGISTYMLSKQAVDIINIKGYKSIDVLAARFHFMLIVAFIYLCFHNNIHTIFEMKIVLIGIIIGAIGYIFPIIFFQMAVNKIGAAKNSMLIGITPLIVTLVEGVSTKELHFDSHLFFSVSLVVLIFIPTLWISKNDLVE